MKKSKVLAIGLALSFIFVLAAIAQQKAQDTAVDPVCGMTVSKATAKATYEYKGLTYYFCSAGCKETFIKDPEQYLAKQMPQPGQGQMMKHGQGPMMHQGKEGQGMAGGCPMMQGKMGQGSGVSCPMMSPEVEKKVENTPDGVTVKITSKNPDTIKKIQDHFTGGACPMTKSSGQKETPKEEKK
jgi:YHS domain-containing protein/TusA-related sulfurtransferase